MLTEYMKIQENLKKKVCLELLRIHAEERSDEIHFKDIEHTVDILLESLAHSEKWDYRGITEHTSILLDSLRLANGGGIVKGKHQKMVDKITEELGLRSKYF